MAATLFILNDAPYGNERAYNALRLAAALAGKEGQQVRCSCSPTRSGAPRAGRRCPRATTTCN